MIPWHRRLSAWSVRGLTLPPQDFKEKWSLYHKAKITSQSLVPAKYLTLGRSASYFWTGYIMQECIICEQIVRNLSMSLWAVKSRFIREWVGGFMLLRSIIKSTTSTRSTFIGFISEIKYFCLFLLPYLLNQNCFFSVRLSRWFPDSTTILV